MVPESVAEELSMRLLNQLGLTPLFRGRFPVAHIDHRLALRNESYG